MFRKIAEGDVFATTKECATSGPRTAVLADGTIACSFMINTCGGANDFVPMITYSKDGGLTWCESKPIWPELEGKKSFFACADEISIVGQGVFFRKLAFEDHIRLIKDIFERMKQQSVVR